MSTWHVTGWQHPQPRAKGPPGSYLNAAFAAHSVQPSTQLALTAPLLFDPIRAITGRATATAVLRLHDFCSTSNRSTLPRSYVPAAAGAFGSDNRTSCHLPRRVHVMTPLPRRHGLRRASSSEGGFPGCVGLPHWLNLPQPALKVRMRQSAAGGSSPQQGAVKQAGATAPVDGGAQVWKGDATGMVGLPSARWVVRPRVVETHPRSSRGTSGSTSRGEQGNAWQKHEFLRKAPVWCKETS